jgi:histidyl-tRNA synthetase
LYPEAVNKPQKPLSYADAQKIPVAILIGEEEHKNGYVTVRNLLTRNQEKPERADAADVVRAMLQSFPGR